MLAIDRVTEGRWVPDASSSYERPSDFHPLLKAARGYWDTITPTAAMREAWELGRGMAWSIASGDPDPYKPRAHREPVDRPDILGSIRDEIERRFPDKSMLHRDENAITACLMWAFVRGFYLGYREWQLALSATEAALVANPAEVTVADKPVRMQLEDVDICEPIIDEFLWPPSRNREKEKQRDS